MSEPAKQTIWSLRAAQPEDEVFLESLFCRLHASDFAGLPLPAEQVRGLVQMQARAQRLGYLRDFPAARSSLVVAEGQPVGRLLVDYQSARIHLVDVALLPEWQGRRIGTALLKQLQNEAQRYAVPLQLSVQPGSPALPLYTRLGFEVVSGGMQLGMEWTPHRTQPQEQAQSLSPGTVSQAADLSGQSAEDPATLFPALTGRRFQPIEAPFELVLARVRHHRAIANASFSLFFQGPPDQVLPQGMCDLLLLDSNGHREREFSIFLVPIGPASGRMEYEAVFNV